VAPQIFEDEGAEQEAGLVREWIEGWTDAGCRGQIESEIENICV
jgi:hypothetical protein